MDDITIFSEEDLKHLFPNQSQRDIFVAGMMRLINTIQNRTVHLPFVQLREMTNE